MSYGRQAIEAVATSILNAFFPFFRDHELYHKMKWSFVVIKFIQLGCLLWCGVLVNSEGLSKGNVTNICFL